MNILITGATGVIGRRLVPLLICSGHSVVAAARSPRGRAEVERHGATTVDVDLFDPLSVSRAVVGQETVINLATHMPESTTQMLLPWAWRENDRIRQIASQTLVESCFACGVARFIQKSFAPVYPDCGDRWIDETTPIRPVRYNRTIADAEAAANRFAQSVRTGIILRFGAFYGPDASHLRELIAWIRKGWAPDARACRCLYFVGSARRRCSRGRSGDLAAIRRLQRRRRLPCDSQSFCRFAG